MMLGAQGNQVVVIMVEAVPQRVNVMDGQVASISRLYPVAAWEFADISIPFKYSFPDYLPICALVHPF